MTIHPLPPRLSSSLDAVWAATYAAAWVAQLREEERITGITAPEDDDADRIAGDAAALADIATEALARLRAREWAARPGQPSHGSAEGQR